MAASQLSTTLNWPGEELSHYRKESRSMPESDPYPEISVPAILSTP